MKESNDTKIKTLISDLAISESTFFHYTGLPSQSLNPDKNGIVRSRIEVIQSIFEMLKNWFDTPEEAWCWYTTKTLAGFGNLTPAEVVIQNPQSGAWAVIDYIKSKELNTFE